MRISDWSSVVCSSDLRPFTRKHGGDRLPSAGRRPVCRRGRRYPEDQGIEQFLRNLDRRRAAQDLGRVEQTLSQGGRSTACKRSSKGPNQSPGAATRGGSSRGLKAAASVPPQTKSVV